MLALPAPLLLAPTSPQTLWCYQSLQPVPTGTPQDMKPCGLCERSWGLCPGGACCLGLLGQQRRADGVAQPGGFESRRSQSGAQRAWILWFQPGRSQLEGVQSGAPNPGFPSPRVSMRGSQSGGPGAAGRGSVGGALRALWAVPSGQAPPPGQSWPVRISRVFTNPPGSWPRPEPISDGFMAPQPISFPCLPPSPLRAPTNQSPSQNPVQPSALSSNHRLRCGRRPISAAVSPCWQRPAGGGLAAGGGGGASLPVPGGRRSGARPGRAGPGAMGE